MKGTSVLRFTILALAVIFIIHQLIFSVYKPIVTETAVFDTATDGFKITGLIIRNEIEVKSSTGGVMHFTAGDGSRVAKGGVIANIYESQSASITVTEILLSNATPLYKTSIFLILFCRYVNPMAIFAIFCHITVNFKHGKTTIIKRFDQPFFSMNIFR